MNIQKYFFRGHFHCRRSVLRYNPYCASNQISL